LGWKINYADTAKGQLRKLDRQVTLRIVDYMDDRVSTADAPRNLGKALTGALGGLWCYRVGDCRIICDIQDEKITVMVLKIGHRREVYKH
jgi:mRNA interferase RelE/StbE